MWCKCTSSCNWVVSVLICSVVSLEEAETKMHSTKTLTWGRYLAIVGERLLMCRKNTGWNIYILSGNLLLFYVTSWSFFIQTIFCIYEQDYRLVFFVCLFKLNENVRYCRNGVIKQNKQSLRFPLYFKLDGYFFIYFSFHFW